MERGIVILLGGVATVGVVGAALYLTGLVKVDVALVPASSTREAVEALSGPTDIWVNADGTIALARHPTSLERLSDDLETASRKGGASPDRTKQLVVVWADPDLPKARLDTVLAYLKANGWKNVRLSLRARKVATPR